MNPLLITSVVHPRADHPGTPWLIASNEIIAASVIDVRLRERQKSFDVLSLPQPSTDWMSFVAAPPAAPFDERTFPPSDWEKKQYRSPNANFKYLESQPNQGWFKSSQQLWEVWDHVGPRDQMRSFRAPGRPLTSIETQPNQGWFKSSQTLWEVWDHTPARDQMRSFRMHERPRTFIETNRDLPWLKTPLNLWEVPFEAASHAQMQVYRPKSSLQKWAPEGDEQQYSYLRQTIPPDISVLPQIKQLIDSYETRTKYKVVDTQPNDGWFYSNLPVIFDTTLFNATNQYNYLPPISLQKVIIAYPDWAWIKEILPVFPAAIDQLRNGYLPPSSLYKVIPSDPDYAWIKENLPVAAPYSTEMIAATFELLRSFIMRSSIKWYSPQQPNIDWAFPLNEVLAASVIDLLPRGMKRLDLLRQVNQPDLGWLYSGIPPVIPFDERNFPRSGEPFVFPKRKFDLRFISQPQDGPQTFIMVDMMAPYLHGFLPDKRKGLDNRYLTQPDLAWIKQNLPAIVFDTSGVAALYELLNSFLPRSSLQKVINTETTFPYKETIPVFPAAILHELNSFLVGKSQKSVVDIGIDLGWIKENLPVIPFDQATMAAIQQLLNSFLPPKSLQPMAPVSIDLGWITINVPPVIASLLRPMRTKNWHRTR